MYDLKKIEAVERAFAEQDKKYNAPKFFGLGIVTLAIAIGLIFWGSFNAIGCTVQVVP
jgi:hypothetical protein